MPSYSTPGVYVNEGTLASLTPSVSGGTSAVFLGAAERGPETATLITDWSSYKRTYGDLKNAYDLGYAVYHFFANGGRSCYVIRVVGTYDSEGGTADSVTPDASSALDVAYYPNGSSAASAALFDAEALSNGTWGDSLKIGILAGLVDTTDSAYGTFTIVIYLNNVEVERWPEVTLNPDGNRYVATVVNTYSKYVRLTNVATDSPDADLAWITEVDQYWTFSGGVQGVVGPQDFSTAIDRVDSVDGTLIINAVGQTSTTALSPIVNKAAARGDSFVVIDPDKSSETLTEVQTVASNFAGLSNGGYAAHYAPALKMVDPAKTGPGAIRTTYPGGAVAGLISRTEVQRSVAKAPAGFSAEISGALGLSVTLSDADLGTLYDGNPYVNSFKVVPGGGIVAYGARTLERANADKFIPVRRTLNYLKYSLKRLTEFAVFEPNDQNLWNRINLVVSGFLGEFYRSGGLRGANASQAFFVVCDGTINTATSIDQGIVNVEVGVALQYPAEFIVINLSQWTGGSNTTESA